MKKPSKTALARTLARPGDPYVTANGHKIQPEGIVKPGTKEADSVPKPSTVTAPQFRPSKKRTVKELPGPVDMVTACGAVFMYTILGLGDREIADCLNLTVPQIKDVRAHSAYSECFDAVANEFINVNSDLINARIAAYSHEALDGIVRVARDGKKEDVVLRANQDLMDRAGHIPKNVLDRSAAMRGELRIVYVKDGDSVGVTLNGG